MYFTVLCPDSKTIIPPPDAGISQFMLWCRIAVFYFCIFKYHAVSAKILHMQPDKNITMYTLVFAIVFLITYAIFTYLWKLLIRSVFVKEENHQAEKLREFNSAISKPWIFRKFWIEPSG